MSATRSTNRLANETSPYLLQHAHNPVDWYPWGEEAFEKARREDKPVFLSIGYSSCHWCHVMERESFESEGIAAVLNERFVSIKVDREERPDVDETYMTFVQLTSGHGGWPLSAFLLADKRPFFGGTYFPPEDRHGRSGFKTLLLRISETWRTRRADVDETAGRMAEEIAASGRLTEKHASAPLGRELLDGLTAALARTFDEERGGFGGAPKFPPHGALEWLLVAGAGGDAAALSLATKTLDAMALGGIHDHLGGGFHRYATDAEWLVPHFEKMLSDNAQLLGTYARAWAVTGRALHRRVALEIGEYLLREMCGPEGAFFGATDADSEGEEGRYFVWTEAEVAELLGADAPFLEERYQVRKSGNYRDEATGRATGKNILHLVEEPSEEEEARLAPLRARLLAARRSRVPPSLDDKRVLGWNALAISGLAIAGRALGEPRFVEAAEGAARFLLTEMRDAAGTLLRTWKDGAGKVPAFLEDEAYLANALLDLADATDGAPSEEWLAKAAEAVASLRRRFRRAGAPGFTFSGEGHERLLSGGRDLFDKAIPSGSASAARALVRLSARNGDAGLASEARDALQEVSSLMARAPHGTETWHLALAELFDLDARSGAREPARARAGAISATASAAAGVAPGGTLEVDVKVELGAGWELADERGLAVEAWAGADVRVASVDVRGDGARVRLEVAPDAARGPRAVALLVRARVCGEGVCLPETVLSLSVPVVVAP